MREGGVRERLTMLLDAGAEASELYEAVIALAMRGKLVPQDLAEGAPCVVRTEVEDQAPAYGMRKSRRRRSFAEVLPEEAPFEIPESWVWRRLGEIGEWCAGTTPSRGEPGYYGGSIPWLKSGELRDSEITQAEETITERALRECSLRLFQPGDVLLAMVGATIGKVGLLKVQATTNQAICACHCGEGVEPRYLMLVLRGYRRQLLSMSAGGVQKNLSKEKMLMLPFPLPPLGEQRRIVEKASELLALCERLGVISEQEQRKKAALREALVSTLGEGGALLQHFDFLTEQPEGVGILRRAIVDLAMRGLLFRSAEGEKPGDAGLQAPLPPEAIPKRRRRTSTMRREAREEPPFAVPSGFRLYALHEVATLAPDLVDPANFPDLPHFAPDTIEKETGRLLSYRTVGEEGVRSPKHRCFRGQILYAKIRPHLAKAALAPLDGLCSAEIYPLIPRIDAAYLHLFLLSSPFLQQVVRKQDRARIPKVNWEELRRVWIAVPSLEEQRRIAEGVARLWALCDRLREDLMAVERRRERLREVLGFGAQSLLLSVSS